MICIVLQRWCLLVFVLTALSGCVSVRAPRQSGVHFQVIPNMQRQAALQALVHWENAGAFSVQPKVGKATLANFSWVQSGAHRYRIQIASALNLYRLMIQGWPGKVTLWRSKTHSISANTPEQLMRQSVGWSLPISNLQYWILGTPAPGAGVTQYDQYGHLSFLKQAGWNVRFLSYRSTQGVDLPYVMTLQRPAMRVRIVLKQWHVFSG